MSKVRLYLDEDSMSHRLVRALAARGLDVTTALGSGLIETPDDKHLEWAAKQGRTLYSYNACDFCRIHSEWIGEGRHHAGIIIAQQQLSVGEQMRRILALAAQRTAEEMADQLVFLAGGH